MLIIPWGGVINDNSQSVMNNNGQSLIKTSSDFQWHLVSSSLSSIIFIPLKIPKCYNMKLFVVTHCFNCLGHVIKNVPRCKKCYRIGPWPLFACVLIQPFLLGSCLFPFLCIPRPYFPWVEILYHMQTNKTTKKLLLAEGWERLFFSAKQGETLALLPLTLA